MSFNPIISVVMPVYNCEKFLREAIDSILTQTFSSFEFLIINDGSTDFTDNIVKSYSDDRIVYLNNESNKGIVASLNIGIKKARGKYIARMDADDIAFPDRLQKLLNYMEANPEVALCGSESLTIDVSGNIISKIEVPILHDEIKVKQLFKNRFIHPTVIIRTEIAREFGYSPKYQYAEDYLLFSQIVLKYKTGNLRETLLYYRIHPDNITTLKRIEMQNSEKLILNYMLVDLFGRRISHNDLEIHHSLIRSEHENISFKEVESHLMNIRKANKVKEIYSPALLGMQLQTELFNFLLITKEKGNYLRLFFSSKIFAFRRFKMGQFRKLVKKTLNNKHPEKF